MFQLTMIHPAAALPRPSWARPRRAAEPTWFIRRLARCRLPVCVMSHTTISSVTCLLTEDPTDAPLD